MFGAPTPFQKFFLLIIVIFIYECFNKFSVFLLQILSMSLFVESLFTFLFTYYFLAFKYKLKIFFKFDF